MKLFSVVLTLLLISLPAVFAADHDDPDVIASLNSGDTTKAIDLLENAIEVDPAYYLNYYALGRIHYERQQWQSAIEQFQVVLDKRKKHYESLLYLGHSQLKLGLLDEAEESMNLGLKKAKKMKPSFENGIGMIHLARENYQEADRAFRRAIASSEVSEQKILKDFGTKKYDSEAEKEATLAEVKNRALKERAEYHINLGDACYYQGISPLAIEEYKIALEIDTASTEVYYHWAEACLEMKDYTCAIEQLSVVLLKDSTYAPAWMRAGGIYFKAAKSTRTRSERKARFMDALGSYLKFIELSGAKADSSHIRVYFELAMSYSNVGGYEEAIPYFEDILNIPYEPRDIYFHYGKSLWYVKDWKKCAEELRKHTEWVNATPENAEATRVKDVEFYQLMGDTYYYDKENRDFARAAENYLKSVEIKPNQKRVVGNLAVALHNSQQQVLAIEFYQKRIEMGIDERSTSILRNAGYCALAIAKTESSGEEDDMDALEEEDEDIVEVSDPDPNVNYSEVAVDYLNQYLEIKPDDDKVLLLIANTYLYDLRDCANGVKWYKVLLQVDPKNCDAKKSLGYAYFGGVCSPKNYTKALGYLRDAYQCMVAVDGKCADVDLTLWIAQCYHLRAVAKKDNGSDDFKAANDWYSKVLACEPGNTEAKKGRDDTSFEF